MTSQQRDYWFTVLEQELRRGSHPRDALVTATLYTADVYGIGPPRCEHGITEGEYCEACNKEYKRAAEAQQQKDIEW